MWRGEVVVQKARSVEEECRGREKAGSARQESDDEVWQARGTRSGSAGRAGARRDTGGAKRAAETMGEQQAALEYTVEYNPRVH